MNGCQSLIWEAKRIREQIAHQYDDHEYDKLGKELNRIKKKLKPKFGKLAKKVVKKFAEIVSVSIGCGKHWREVPEAVDTDTSFAYARKNTSVNYKANVVWTYDDMTIEDYLSINVWIDHLEPFAYPRVELNQLCVLFNRMPTVHFSGDRSSIMTMGNFDNVFCHFNLYLKKPDIEKFDFTGTFNSTGACK